MPIASSPDHSQRIVITTCSAVIAHADIEHYQCTTWLEPTIYGYNELFDMTAADFRQLEYANLIEIAQKASKLYMLDPDSRFAFVCQTSNQQELAEFYLAAKQMIKAPSRDIKIFNSHQSALDWLNEDYR